jgi:hypothetical protein
MLLTGVTPMPLIKAQEPVEATKLCDLDIDLRTLAGATS